MRTKIFFLLLITALFQLPALGYSPVQSDINEFNQPTYAIRDIFTVMSTMDDPNSVFLSLTATKVSAIRLDYTFTIRYENTQRVMFNIPKGETLIFLIDGKKISLDGNGSINHRKYLVWHLKNTEELDDINGLSEREKENITAVKETAQYKVPQEVLQQMSEAEEVKLQIKGEKDALTYTLPQATLAEIRYFMGKYSN